MHQHSESDRPTVKPLSKSRLKILAGLLTVMGIALALVPHAQARDAAKFKVLSISGTETTDRDVVYAPSDFASCAFSQSERISFHSTKPVTAYAFTSKAHGRARVAWSPTPAFAGNLTQVEVPGVMTVSRSATYQQGYDVDPDTGETSPGCFHEPSPVNCKIEETMPATLNIGGTSDQDKSTYIQLSADQRALNELDEECPMTGPPGTEDARLFSRGALFDKQQKRLRDANRVEEPVFDNASDDQSETGSIVQELAGELRRVKQRR